MNKIDAWARFPFVTVGTFVSLVLLLVRSVTVAVATQISSSNAVAGSNVLDFNVLLWRIEIRDGADYARWILSLSLIFLAMGSFELWVVRRYSTRTRES